MRPHNPRRQSPTFGDADGSSSQIVLVGVKEIAERLGVPRGTVSIWKLRGLVPEPEVELGLGPVWRWATIERWARKTGRLKEEE
jgi:hypothetical protein